MDTTKTYKNPKLELRRKQNLQRQQADDLLRRRKCRGPDIDRARQQVVSTVRAAGRDAADAANRLIDTVAARSRLLDPAYAPRYTLALCNLAAHRLLWVRPPEGWTARSHNVDRQFASFTRHLLARYAVPAWLDACWLGQRPEDTAQQGWFIHIGEGKNLRKAERLPVPLTKMMAHHALEAPDGCSAVQAIRWGQCRGQNMPLRLADAVLGSRLGQAFASTEQEAFWSSVIHWLTLNPTLDPRQISPIMDYLHEQKFVAQGPVNANGTFQEVGPAQPGLSMKQRDPDALVAQVEAWHRRLRHVREVRHLHWPSCGIAGYDRVEGVPGNQRRLLVRELLSSSELKGEGAAMRHCVYSYSWSCQAGRTAIYSMTVEDRAGVRRLLTLEVDVRRREIVQARGRFNATATAFDQRILQAWATVARLAMARWAVARM